MTPLELYNKFKANPIWNKLVAKYPDRDYEYQFDLMCDYYLAKKKRLPQMISAFDNWLSRTAPDTGLMAARQAEQRKVDTQKAMEAEKDLKPVRPETLANLKEQIDKLKRRF